MVMCLKIPVSVSISSDGTACFDLWALAYCADEKHAICFNCCFACVQVPDGATVALVPRLTKHIHRENQDYIPGESEFDVLFS